MPRVTVVMAVYNDAQFLARSIESILNQTFTDFEFIIVNDGSTDTTASILGQYTNIDRRIRIVNCVHGGLTRALNIGLGYAEGDYIARMDADDVASQKRFAAQVSYLDRFSNVGLCGTQGILINERGKELGKKQLPVSSSEIKKKILFNNQFIHSSWMVRKSVLEDVGFYDESFKKSQDYDLVLRVAQKFEVANLSEPLISWRVRSASLSWIGKRQEWDAIRARWRAVRKYGYSFWKGIFHIILRLAWLCIPQRLKFQRYDV